MSDIICLMIKAIILDVDGVIVGEKIGFNSPYPHPDVIERLRSLRQKGIFISLCSAKPHYSVKKIVNDAELNNLHITNGGSVIIDPIENIIFKKHVINNFDAVKVIDIYLENNVYTEFYTVNEYVIQDNQVSDITKTHTHILQREPKIVSSLINEARKSEVIKIMPIAKNEEDKKKLMELFKPFVKDLTLSWGIHPIALPHQFGIITAKGISKKQAALEIAQKENVKPEEMLGIGDSLSDWQFIKSCRFGGTMGNANEELKKLVLSKGEKYSFIGRSVDENGILDIFEYFDL